MNQQPEALRLYDSYNDSHTNGEYSLTDRWMVSAADELKRQHAENEALRRMLAVRVAGSALYSDDGELSDCRTLPYIDFKRDTAQEIEDKIMARGLKDLDAAREVKP